MHIVGKIIIKKKYELKKKLIIAKERKKNDSKRYIYTYTYINTKNY